MIQCFVPESGILTDLRLSWDGHREDLEPMLGGQVGQLLLLDQPQAGRLALAHHDDGAADAGSYVAQRLGKLIGCVNDGLIWVIYMVARWL